MFCRDQQTVIVAADLTLSGNDALYLTHCRSESNHIGTLNYNSQNIVSDIDKASVFKSEIFDG